MRCASQAVKAGAATAVAVMTGKWRHSGGGAFDLDRAGRHWTVTSRAEHRARPGDLNIEHGLVIRVKTTARHRRVLMASHTLEKVQLDAGVGPPH
jgi:hypothetical protein